MPRGAAGQRRGGRHYHVVEGALGNPLSYRDDVYMNRRGAAQAAKERAEWLAYLGGGRAEALLGPPGRYLVTTGSRDAGRLILVEDCEDAACVKVGDEPRLKS